jgi:hypothetical protein
MQVAMESALELRRQRERAENVDTAGDSHVIDAAVRVKLGWCRSGGAD